jgi:hypothetical protein
MAKHFAAADIGGRALTSEENPNSKRGKGEVTKRRKWPTILAAIAGKLAKEGCQGSVVKSKKTYVRTKTVVAFNAAS